MASELQNLGVEVEPQLVESVGAFAQLLLEELSHVIRMGEIWEM